MSKAILVIDEPKMCGECALRMAMICTPTMKDIDSVNGKMDWCPLKTLPNPIDVSGCKTEITKARAQEYNALLVKLSS